MSRTLSVARKNDDIVIYVAKHAYFEANENDLSIRNVAFEYFKKYNNDRPFLVGNSVAFSASYAKNLIKQYCEENEITFKRISVSSIFTVQGFAPKCVVKKCKNVCVRASMYKIPVSYFMKTNKDIKIIKSWDAANKKINNIYVINR